MASNKVGQSNLKKNDYKFKAFSLRILSFFLVSFLFVSSNAFAGGVTIITHGFASGSQGWVANMGLNIGYQIVDETEAKEGKELTVIPYATYEIEITNNENNINGYQYTGSVSKDELSSGYNLYWGLNNINIRSMAESRNGEAIILVGWSDIDQFGVNSVTTQDVAYLVREALLINDSAFGDSPLTVPIHLIGHSRGGSVVGALAEYLGEWNIWVDQVTFLDPHPIGFDWGDWGDIEVTSNVRFADNYYRTGGSQIPNGEEVVGTNNFRLNNDFLERTDVGGYSDFLTNEHADVHLWYQGTINIFRGITDGEASISSIIIDEWYNSSNLMPGPRDKTGFYYSRIVGGNRTYTGSANSNRPVVEKTQTSVANLDAFLTTNISSPVTIGNNISVNYRYQAIEDCSISFGFDEDPNPFNNTSIDWFTIPSLPATSDGTVFDDGLPGSISLTTSSKLPGNYYLIAKIVSSGGFTRYVHSSELVTLENPSPIEPDSDPDLSEPPFNNSPGEATDLGVVSGETSFTTVVNITPGDVDYYKFEIVAIGTQNDNVEIYLTEGSGVGSYDLDLAIGELNNNQLVPANGEKYWIKSMSQSEHRLNTVSLEGYDPGIYYAIVYGGSGFTDVAETTPDYDFSNGTGDEASLYNLFITGPLPTVATPAISPNGGTFIGSKLIALSSSTSGAWIRYTTDGTAPTANSTQYTVPFILSSSSTIMARSFKNDYNDSEIETAVFTINFIPELAVTPVQHVVSADSVTTQFDVVNIGSGDMDWTASVVSGETWLSITPSPGGTITATYLANTLDSTRMATIRVVAPGADGSPLDITVVQSAAIIEPPPPVVVPPPVVTPPPPPTGVSASDGDSTSYVSVSWKSSIGATDYQLYRCTDSSTNSCGHSTYSGSSLRYNDTGSPAGTTYYYRVKASNSDGTSEYSGYDTGYKAINIPPPPATVNISAIPSVTEGSTISLTGTVNTNGNTIVSYRWEQTGGTTVTISYAGQLNAAVPNIPAGNYTFQLTLTDQLNRTVVDTVSVSISAASVPPPETETPVETETPPQTQTGTQAEPQTSSGGSSGGGSMGPLVLLMTLVLAYRKRKLQPKR